MTSPRYLRGLAILEHGEAPTCSEDLVVADDTLRSLRAAAMGAGGNTWRHARDRYRRAAVRFADLTINKGETQ